jgi:predicted lysophospholipase L1 biosynthesis ABC-type transport system permease subunit
MSNRPVRIFYRTCLAFRHSPLISSENKAGPSGFSGQAPVPRSLQARCLGLLSARLSSRRHSIPKEHLYEFATLRAMGASDSYIYQVIICQALLNAIVGFAIAGLIGTAIVHFTAKSALQVVISPSLIIELFVLTLLMCIVSAISAIFRVVRVDPAIVLTR